MPATRLPASSAPCVAACGAQMRDTQCTVGEASWGVTRDVTGVQRCAECAEVAALWHAVRSRKPSPSPPSCPDRRLHRTNRGQWGSAESDAGLSHAGCRSSVGSHAQAPAQPTQHLGQPTVQWCTHRTRWCSPAAGRHPCPGPPPAASGGCPASAARCRSTPRRARASQSVRSTPAAPVAGGPVGGLVGWWVGGWVAMVTRFHAWGFSCHHACLGGPYLLHRRCRVAHHRACQLAVHALV